MKKFFILFLMLCSWRMAFCQNDTTLTIVEHHPSFPGGLNSFYQYIAKNLKYPEKAQKNGTQGKVHAQFVIKRDGKLSDIKILKGIGDGCDEEVVRVLQASALWNPGMQKGRAVNVRMTLPVTFIINPAVLDTVPTDSLNKINPSFPGGLEGFYKYIAQNLQYPRWAQENKIQGKVFVQFVINTHGELTSVKILKGIGYGCDKEVVRILKKSPLWNPGMEKGTPVNVMMSLPITFRLN